MPDLTDHEPTPIGSEVHLGDNYFHLLMATTDLAGRPPTAARLVLFSTDGLPLEPDLRRSIAAVTSAEIQVVSDREAISDYARLPGWVPGMLRRNVSWTRSGRPVRPAQWTPDFLAERCFETGYVYHPGFFLSKVVAGRCERVVMRDSGYANYVHHRVPWPRRLPRVMAGRSGRIQVYGEEPWVDSIEVARPELLPASVRVKATQLTLDQLMRRLEPSTRRRIARAFWGPHPPVILRPERTALLVTQPLAALSVCSPAEARELYEDLAERLRTRGFEVVVKPHPRQTETVLPGQPTIPASFPIEAWAWLGQRPFDVAVSLNSTALSAEQPSFAIRSVQLIERDRFYPRHWPEWPDEIDAAFARWASE